MKRKIVFPVVICISAFSLIACDTTTYSNSSSSKTSNSSSQTELSSSTSLEETSSLPISSSSTSSTSETSSSSSETSQTKPDPLLKEALDAMGLNYTANVYYSGELTYKHICTEDGIYKDYFSEYNSSGFMFDENDYAYFFELKDGVVQLDETPYEDFYGNYYTKQNVIDQDYFCSILQAEWFTKQAPNTYYAKDEFLATIANKLLYVDEPEEVILTTESGKVKDLQINNFYDDYYGSLDSVEITFTDVGTTTLDFETEKVPSFLEQLPNENDPSKPTAPTTYDLENYHEVDPYTLPNDDNEGINPELQQAINAQKVSTNYTFEDYFDDTINKDKSDWNPSSSIYNLRFNGNKAYLKSQSSGVSNYVVKSNDIAYRIDLYGIYYSFVERDDSFEERTLGGNIFQKLSAKMFDKVNDTTYKGKQEYYSDFEAMVNLIARDAASFYDGNPTTYVSNVELQLEDGQISKLIIERYFTFNDGADDLQRFTITIDSDSEVVKMPFEEGYYTQDEQKLVDAIKKAGNNYTVNYKYYDDTIRTEYYGDRVIFKDYYNDFGSSGYVYVNDYAYFFDMTDGIVNVDDTPYKPYFNSDLECYRAYMNKMYLPLVQLNPKDFEFDGTKYSVKYSALEDYDYILFGTGESIYSMDLTLSNDGYIDTITMDSDGWGGDATTSTLTISDIGTTNFTGRKE